MLVDGELKFPPNLPPDFEDKSPNKEPPAQERSNSADVVLQVGFYYAAVVVVTTSLNQSLQRCIGWLLISASCGVQVASLYYRSGGGKAAAQRERGADGSWPRRGSPGTVQSARALTRQMESCSTSSIPRK